MGTAEGEDALKLQISCPREPRGEIRIAEELEAFNEAKDARLVEAFEKYAPILLEELWNLTPKKTGETAQSWEVFYDVAPMRLWMTNSNQPLATYLSMGTVDHWVEPLGLHAEGGQMGGWPQALHWVVGGIDFFSKGHMVSGIMGLNMEQDAVLNTSDALDALIDEALDLAWDDAFERGGGESAKSIGGEGEGAEGGESDLGGDYGGGDEGGEGED
jgi:hypothetical protein